MNPDVRRTIAHYMQSGYTSSELLDILETYGYPETMSQQEATFYLSEHFRQLGGPPPAPTYMQEGEYGMETVTGTGSLYPWTTWIQKAGGAQLRGQTEMLFGPLGATMRPPGPEGWPEGMVSRGGRQYWPADIYTQAWQGVPGPTPGSILISQDISTPEGQIKLAKRTQQFLGAYEQPELYDPSGTSLMVQAPLRAGPRMPRADRGFTAPIAMLTEEWLPEGMMGLPPGLIGYGTSRRTRERWFPETTKPRFVSPGTQWSTGQAIQPYAGAAPLRMGLGHTADWVTFLEAYEIPQTREIRGEEVPGTLYRMQFETGASFATLRPKLATGPFKFTAAEMGADIIGMPSHGISQIKDVAGLPYAYWQAHPEQAAEALGMSYGEYTQQTWQGVGHRLYQEFTEKVLPSIYQTRRMQYPADVSQLSLLPAGRFTQEPIPGRPGQVMVSADVGVIAADWFVQARQDYGVRTHTIPYREMETLGRTSPELYERIAAESSYERRARFGAIGATLASAGAGYGVPPGTLFPSDVQVQKVMAQAEQIAMGRAGVISGQEVTRMQDVPPHIYERAIVESAAGAWGERPIQLAGNMVSMAPEYIRRFGVEGPWEYEEASSVGRAFGQALMAFGGPPEVYGPAVERLRTAQAEFAGGREFKQRAMRAFTARTFGEEVQASQIAPANVVIPPPGPTMAAFGIPESQRAAFEAQWKQGPTGGLDPQGFFYAQPSRGDVSFGGTVSLWHPEYARKVGLEQVPGNRIIANPMLLQYHGKDSDGDDTWITVTGEAVAIKGGKFEIIEPTGVRRFTPADIQAGAKEALRYGRPTAARGGGFESLEAVQEALRGLQPVGAEQVAMSMGAWQEYVQDIGQYYNVLEDISQAAERMGVRGASERLMESIYGQAQTPAPLPQDLYDVAQIFSRLTPRGGGRQTHGGEFFYVHGRGMTGAQRALFGAIAGGESLTPEVAGQMLAPRERAGQMGELIERFRATESRFERGRIAAEAFPLMGGATEWGMGTPLGAQVAARFAGRRGATARGLGMDPELFEFASRQHELFGSRRALTTKQIEKAGIEGLIAFEQGARNLGVPEAQALPTMGTVQEAVTPTETVMEGGEAGMPTGAGTSFQTLLEHILGAQVGTPQATSAFSTMVAQSSAAYRADPNAIAQRPLAQIRQMLAQNVVDRGGSGFQAAEMWAQYLKSQMGLGYNVVSGPGGAQDIRFDYAGFMAQGAGAGGSGIPPGTTAPPAGPAEDGEDWLRSFVEGTFGVKPYAMREALGEFERLLPLWQERVGPLAAQGRIHPSGVPLTRRMGKLQSLVERGMRQYQYREATGALTSQQQAVMGEVQQVAGGYGTPVAPEWSALQQAQGLVEQQQILRPFEKLDTTIERLTETIDTSRVSFEKWGQVFQEQVEQYQQGRFEPSRDWWRAARLMGGQAQAIAGGAEQLGGMLPAGLQPDITAAQGIGGLFGAAQQQQTAQILQAGFQQPTGIMAALQRFAPARRGIFGGQLGGLAWGMFNLQRLWRYTGGAVAQDMQRYAGFVAQQQQGAAALGMGEGFGGEAADILGSRAAMERFRLGTGQAAWQTWGWIPRGIAQMGGGTQPSELQRAISFGRPLVAAPGGLAVASGIAGMMGAGGLATVLGAGATAAGFGAAALVGGYIGGGIAKWAAPRVGLGDIYPTEISAMFGAARGAATLGQMPLALAARGAQAAGWQRGAQGLAEVAAGPVEAINQLQQWMFPEAEELGPGQQAFTSAVTRVMGEGVNQESAISAVTSYSQISGRTPDTWTDEDYQRVQGLTRLAPGTQQQVLAGAPQYAIGLGAQYGTEQYAGLITRYGQMGPTQRYQAGMMADVLGPIQQQRQAMGLAAFPTGGMEFRTQEDVWRMGRTEQARLGLIGQLGELGVAPSVAQGAVGGMDSARLTIMGRRLERFQQGDPRMISEFGLAGGEPVPGLGGVLGTYAPNLDLVTQEPSTGLAIGTQQAQLSGRVLGRHLGQVGAPGRNIDLQGGQVTINVAGSDVKVDFTEWGLQDFATQQQREQQQWQFGFARQGLDLQQAAMQGGTYGGYTFAGQFNMQRQQLDIQQQQFYDRYGLSQQRLSTQAQWGYQDIATQYGRQQTQFRWAEEDIAYRGAVSTMQYGWGMEDIEENLRYATGRERRGLMRQRERQTIMYGMGMGQLDTDRQRLDERRQWAEEDHEKAKDRHGQRTSWAQRELDMSRRHFEQNQQFAHRRLQVEEQYWELNFSRQELQLQKRQEWWEIEIDIQNKVIGFNRTRRLQLEGFQAAWNSFMNQMIGDLRQAKSAAADLGDAINGFLVK